MKAVLLLLLVNFCVIFADPLFFRGRPWGEHGFHQPPRSRSGNFKAAPAQWMPQTLDHFNPADTRTWKQRYFVGDKYFKEGGPVFLQLGGEGTADPVWLSEGQAATNFAKKYNALNILLEHRYYGESHPTPDISTHNLRFLTSEQALADAATFIEYFKTNNPNVKNSKWVVFGGSYSGSLAAWMRAKYPHLVAGAVASSAPMKAVINFQDYLAVVRESLGVKCDASIKLATEQLAAKLEKPTEWAEIKKSFLLCDDLNAQKKNDVSNLISSLAGNFEGIVQYNKDNRAFEKAPATNITIDTICGVMTDASNGEELSRYAKVNKIILDAYGQQCLDFKYSNFINTMRQVNWSSNAGGARQWTYQTCVEFGFFQSSDLKDQPFGHYFPVEFFEKQCRDIYGSEFYVDLLQKGVDFTNTHYGAYGIKLSNTVLPNGSIDPWHALGLLNYTNANAKSIFIEGTAHCADTYPESGDDPKALIDARNEISDYIGTILNSK